MHTLQEVLSQSMFLVTPEAALKCVLRVDILRKHTACVMPCSDLVFFNQGPRGRDVPNIFVIYDEIQ